MSIVQVSVLPGRTMAAAPMHELLDERLAHHGRARRGHGSRYVAPGPRCHICTRGRCGSYTLVRVSEVAVTGR